VHDLDALRTTLEGDLLTPISPGYDSARRPALARYLEVRPAAVVRCASVRDVARAINYAAGTGTHLVPRGGGHCFAGRSSTDGLVLDLSRLDTVRVGADGRATIGAGARLARVYDVLHEHGRAIPAGCGPTVGIAGLTLGGGIGLLGRVHGLTCDELAGAQVVLADGRVVASDIDHEPELFWGLRGAGGGQFGVVTSLIFTTVPEPQVTRFELSWPEATAAEVIAAWQEWAPHVPDEVTANLTVAAERGQPLRCAVFGACLRDAEATASLLDGLAAASSAQPRTRISGGLSVRDLKRTFVADAPGPDAYLMTSRSEFFAHPLPIVAIAALLDELTVGPSGRRALNFTAMGGAYNRVAPSETAFAHRGESFLLEHVAYDGSEWADRSWAIAHRHGSGRVYPNFPDPKLEHPEAAYHGDNWARLLAIKQSYDPDRFFHFPQAI